jgi:hypothetical protein
MSFFHRTMGRHLPPDHWIFTIASVTLAVVVIAAVLVLPLAVVAVPVLAHAYNGKARIEEALTLMKAGHYGVAQAKAESAAREFAAARQDNAHLLWLGSVPVLGEYVTAGDQLLQTGEQGAASAAAFLGIGADVIDASGEQEGVTAAVAKLDLHAIMSDLRPEARQRIIKKLIEDVPRLRTASEKASLALVAFDAMPKTGVASSWHARLAPQMEQFRAARDATAAVLPAAEALPAAFGFPTERHYLVFFENNTELRPTGGFLGVYGLLTVKDAEITDLKTDDVYALDWPNEGKSRPAAPAPIQKYLGVAKWYLRDANWSPDFPTSAAKMEQFFREEASVAWGADKVPPIDGVIAFTPELAKGILSVIGPVQADGKTFTPDNLVDQLEFVVEREAAAKGVAIEDRKNIVSHLTDVVRAKIQAADLAQLAALARVFEKSVAEKHLRVWLKDESLQAMAARQGWTGEVKPTRDDTVMVVDANLASLKTDQAVERQYRYTLRPDAQGYVGSVAIDYENRGGFTWKTTRYRTYARVYLPPGSQLIGVRGAMADDKIKDPGRHAGKPDQGDELGRHWLGAFISVEPGEKRTLEFRFRLAPAIAASIAAGEYRLNWLKQGGLLGPSLTLDLDFGKKLTNAEPAEDRTNWGDTRYRLQTELYTDRLFSISL